jgi:hypothetical protein
VASPDEKIPHGLISPLTAGVHDNDQSTPPLLVESFVTVALRGLDFPLTGKEEGAPLIGPMVGTGVVTVIMTVTNGLGLAAAVAITETDRPLAGTVVGAVYKTAVPLAVWAGLLGLNVPQEFELFEQETDQFTPALVLSPETMLTMLAVAPVFMAVGGGGFKPKAMDTVPEDVTVTFVVTV